MRFGQFRPEVLAAVSQAPSVKKQVRAVAAEIRKEARRLAPKETGNLRKNIAVENVYDQATRMVEYHVGWNKKAWYGALVEFGTEDTAARPHLRPAADKFRNQSAPDPGDSELIDYTTKSGVTRKATRAQVANWTRGR